MNRLTYNLLLKTISPVALHLFAKKARKAGGEWGVRCPERFGNYENLSRSSEPSVRRQRPVWIHAVSLGETIAAQPLVRHLLDQGLPVLLTSMTATGRRQAERLFAEDIAAGRLQQMWVPYDLPKAVKGFFDYWQPRCGILIEREVWANLIAEAKQRGIPMLLVSARFSERALKQTRKMGEVMKEALESLDVVLAQTRHDALRLQHFNLQEIHICGNLKFDLTISREQILLGQNIKKTLSRPIVVISSTREGEEQMFLDAMLTGTLRSTIRQHQTLYVIVPRHPERFRSVEKLIQHSGLGYVKRSDNPERERLMQADICLGDSLGEMFMYYSVADIAIVGGGFVNLGGQNHIEASALGVPVIVGPYTRNFEQAVEDAIVEGAARRTDNPEQALELAEELIEHPARAKAMSRGARQWLSLHNGVAQKIAKYIERYV